MPPDSSAADRNGFGASMSGSAAVPLFGPGPVQSTSTALPPFDQQQLQLYGQSLHQDQQPQHSSQHSHQQQPQRKRKSSSGGKGTPSGDKRARQGSSAGEDDDDKVKRAKTPRACDQCRRKKVRCDILEGADPPICRNCSSVKKECTFFLPISETRWKRQRPPKESSADASSLSTSVGTSSAPPASFAAVANPPHFPSDPYQHAWASRQGQQPSQGSQVFGAGLPPLPSFPSSSFDPSSFGLSLGSSPRNPTLPGAQTHGKTSPADNGSQHTPSSNTSAGHRRRESRIMGPTSITHLLHSTSTFPADTMVPVDIKYSQTLQVGESGDGLIRVVVTGDSDDSDSGDQPGQPGNSQTIPTVVQGIERETAERLINYYFQVHSAHFPIVSRADFLQVQTPNPLLFNAICAVSACSHNVQPGILRTLKQNIRNLLRQDEMYTSSISTIQSLLLYTFSLEMERGRAGSFSWNLLGFAIRMAQDIGLHRDLRSSHDADHAELRRRVWGGCLIADRWVACIYGLPMMIDLADCDTYQPSVYEVRAGAGEAQDQPLVDLDQRPYLFNANLISLSVILGRILKAIYSPTGILTLSAEAAEELFHDLDKWKDELPEELKFKGMESGQSSGFLHLLYVPVRFLITRPFMRVSFALPERFSNIVIGNEAWTEVEKSARDAILWVANNDSCLEGFFPGMYAFFIAALIQYHAHIRRRDDTSLRTLQLARDVVKRLTLVDGDCLVRVKTAELLHLLYSTAVTVSQWAPETAELRQAAQKFAWVPGAPTSMPMKLNPTPGVRQRAQDWDRDYRPDLAAYSNSVSSMRSTNDPGAGGARSTQDTASGSPSGGGDKAPEWRSSVNFNPTLNSQQIPSDLAAMSAGLSGGAGFGTFDLPSNGTLADFGLGSDLPSSLALPPDSLFQWSSWSNFFSAVPRPPGGYEES